MDEENQIDYVQKKYKLTAFDKINYVEKEKLSILAFVKIAYKEFIKKYKIPLENIYDSDNEIIFFIYFIVMQHYLIKDGILKSRKNTLKDTVKYIYDNKLFNLEANYKMEGETEEQFLERMPRIVKNHLEYHSIFILQYFGVESFQNGSRLTGYKIPQNYVNEIDFLLLKHNKNKVYKSIKKNKYKNIKYFEYETFITEIKEEINKLDNGLKKVRLLYMLERLFNFELIKDICNAINTLDMLFDNYYQQEKKRLEQQNQLGNNVELFMNQFLNNYKNYKKVYITEIMLLCYDSADNFTRHRYINLYLNEIFNNDISFSSRRKFRIIAEQANQLKRMLKIIEKYVYYLLESNFKIAAILGKINDETNQFDKENKQFGINTYCSPHKINDNFTEENFKLVMKILEVRIDTDSILTRDKENELKTKILKEFEKNSSILDIAGYNNISVAKVKQMISLNVIHSKLLKEKQEKPSSSILSLSKKFCIHRNTVKRWLLGKEPYEYPKRKKRPSKLDDFKLIIDNLMSKGQISSTEIYNIIKNKGYTGSRSLIKHYLNPVTYTRNGKKIEKWLKKQI